MNAKPSIGFINRTANGPFSDAVNTILTKMKDNPNFATPVPTLTVVTTNFNAFTVAAANAVKGGAQAIALRDARKEELASLLRQLANYVDSTASGDLEKLLSSGFPTQRRRGSRLGHCPPRPRHLSRKARSRACSKR